MPVTLWVLFWVTSYLQREGSLCNNEGQQHIKKVFSFSELECSLTSIQLQENFGPRLTTVCVLLAVLWSISFIENQTVAKNEKVGFLI